MYAGTMQPYIMLCHVKGVPSGAATTVKQAGGILVASYGQIGVVIVRSDQDAFSANLLKSDARIESVVATSSFASRINDDDINDETEAPSVNTPAAGSDNLSGLQWDMDQIQSPQARAITGGSSSVVVGDIDTGLEYTHPDLAPNVDISTAVSCVGGVPNTSPGSVVRR